MALRNQLETLFTLSNNERQEIGRTLRQRVVEEHSFEQLIRKLICVMHMGEIAVSKKWAQQSRP
jgi:hypothetical protein